MSDDFDEPLDDFEAYMLPIHLKHLSQVTSLPFHHRDPFDRLMIAQSMVEKLPIVVETQLLMLMG